MTASKKINWSKDISLKKTFPDKAKEEFYKEFSSLLESGIDIQRTLTILIEEQSNKKLLLVLESILDLLVTGSSLSEALKSTGHFTAYEYHSIRIGEETGRLQVILEHLSEYFTNKVKLRRQLISVFTYPTFVILITIGVLYFMLNSVVPMFEDVFKQFGQELPYLTQKIILVSKHFSTFLMYFGIIMLTIVIYAYTQRKEDWYRNITAKMALRMPVFGVLMKKIYLARTCQSLSLLLGSKTPLVSALELVEEMIGFYPLEKALASIKNDIVKGGTFSAGLAQFPIFDKRLVSLTKIAEETNQLDRTFDRLSKQYQEDIEFRTKLIGTIIEPLIIVIIGLVVGVIMVAMYLPMFNLSNVIK
ncbi:MAG: type II secretion system F family protein [Crocinitomicaceae bacterium]|nr:type II secretion system F family protein [Crocinitomicaceae bacterium]